MDAGKVKSLKISGKDILSKTQKDLEKVITSENAKEILEAVKPFKGRRNALFLPCFCLVPLTNNFFLFSL